MSRVKYQSRATRVLLELGLRTVFYTFPKKASLLEFVGNETMSSAQDVSEYAVLLAPDDSGEAVEYKFKADEKSGRYLPLDDDCTWEVRTVHYDGVNGGEKSCYFVVVKRTASGISAHLTSSLTSHPHTPSHTLAHPRTPSHRHCHTVATPPHRHNPESFANSASFAVVQPCYNPTSHPNTPSLRTLASHPHTPFTPFDIATDCVCVCVSQQIQ